MIVGVRTFLSGSDEPHTVLKVPANALLRIGEGVEIEYMMQTADKKMLRISTVGACVFEQRGTHDFLIKKAR